MCIQSKVVDSNRIGTVVIIAVSYSLPQRRIAPALLAPTGSSPIIWYSFSYHSLPLALYSSVQRFEKCLQQSFLTLFAMASYLVKKCWHLSSVSNGRKGILRKAFFAWHGAVVPDILTDRGKTMDRETSVLVLARLLEATDNG